ncbi:death-associated inhibitor of apoptosis 1 [Trichonephila clavipes]|nr:death-associated inhibitor of apoptosis 1 [Trichonephila clavipes]
MKRIVWLPYRNWPLLMLNPKQLAKCGFYYTGVLDVVTCYCCNGSLGNWKSDDPLTEHEKFFPHCEYMDLIRMKLNNKTKCLKNQVLQETCKIFSTLKAQVAASRNTGQREKVAISRNTGQREKVAISRNTGQREKVAISRNTGQREDTGAENTIICKICMNDEMNVVFQQCSHFISCHICAEKIFDCPLCRNPVIHKIKAFRG